MTYEQRRKTLVDSVLAKLKEMGHESDLIEPDDATRRYSYFRRSSDGVTVMAYITPCYWVHNKTEFPEVMIVGFRRQKFVPSITLVDRKLSATNEVDPAKVAAKVIREFEHEAKRLSDESRRKSLADAVDAKADEINQRIGADVVHRSKVGSHDSPQYVMQVGLRHMNEGEVESFVDAMHAAGLLHWLRERK